MKNKFYLAWVLFFSVGVAARSVVPDRIITPSLNMFDSKNKILPSGDVEVQVTGWDNRGRFRKNQSQTTIPKEQYEHFKALSRPVFEMNPSKRSNTPKREPRAGTAFHIGNNLVLTNHHVLDPDMSSKSCGDFQLTDQSNNVFRCKKVHYCSSDPEIDLCLIEMNSIMKRDCFFCSAPKYEVSLNDLGALKLKGFYYPHPTDQSSEILTAIGNSAGFGIHLSQGRGLSFIAQRLLFYAPITTGNSGGALLNDEDLVVGIVRAQSETTLGSDPKKVYNVALPSYIAIRLIREALESDPETLEKFNSSVVE